MKFRHASLFSAALAALSPASVSAVVYSFPFSVFQPVGTQVGGKDGWTVIGDSTYTPTDANGLSLTSTLNGSTCAALGGYYYAANPAETPIYLTHSASTWLESTSFAVTFAIQGAVEGDERPGRDGFGFTLQNDNRDNLLTISLAPAASPSLRYQVLYTVGAGSPQAAKNGADDMYIDVNGLYSLDLKFTENGANPTFSATVTGSDVQTFNGTATGLGSELVGNMGALWNVIDNGNNIILFDNIAIVPEPSTSLLAGLATIGLLRRRRRA